MRCTTHMISYNLHFIYSENFLHGVRDRRSACCTHRKKPKHRSEMTNQLLFGEAVRVLKSKGPLWVKIASMHDGYEGWTTNTLLHEVNELQANIAVDYLTSAMFNTIDIGNKKMHLPFGASLPAFTEGNGKIDGLNYSFNGHYVNRNAGKPGSYKIQQLTSSWLNAPYLWGGRTIFGVDCSGFVQVNYRMMGIDLPRDAWQQAKQGIKIKKLKDALCGDLAFFNDKEEIVHVGILLSNEQIIHSSGRVRIDSIDKKGIINSTTGKYTHSLKSIKRYW